MFKSVRDAFVDISSDEIFIYEKCRILKAEQISYRCMLMIMRVIFAVLVHVGLDLEIHLRLCAKNLIKDTHQNVGQLSTTTLQKPQV